MAAGLVGGSFRLIRQRPSQTQGVTLLGASCGRLRGTPGRSHQVLVESISRMNAEPRSDRSALASSLDGARLASPKEGAVSVAGGVGAGGAIVTGAGSFGVRPMRN